MRTPSNVRLGTDLEKKDLRTLDYKKVKQIWYLDGYQEDKYVKESVRWLEKFKDQYNCPIDVFPFQEYIYGLGKIPQFDLIDSGINVSTRLKESKLDVDLLIAFGPERYDSILSVAEQHLMSVVYIFPQPRTEAEIKQILCGLPIYPYYTPFTEIYFTDILTTLSNVLPSLCCFTEE
jgi:hypothetical protein